MVKISHLEKKQNRPCREIIKATLNNTPIPKEASKKLLDLDEKIKDLRSLL